MELITTKNNTKYIIYPNDYIGKTIKEYGYFSPTEIFFLSKFINESDNILEIGANIGSHCIPLSQKNYKGKYYCFEPQLDIFKMLTTNITLNNCVNVIPYNYGISQRNQTIYYNQNLNDINRGGFAIPNNQKSGKDFLKIRSMDYFTEMDNLDNLKLIKVDVEGYECEVIEDLEYLINKHSPILFIEYNFETFYPLQNILNNMNYDVYYFNTTCNQYDELIDVKNDNIKYCDINIVCFSRKLQYDIPTYLQKVENETFPQLHKVVLLKDVN